MISHGYQPKKREKSTNHANPPRCIRGAVPLEANRKDIYQGATQIAAAMVSTIKDTTDYLRLKHLAEKQDMSVSEMIAEKSVNQAMEIARLIEKNF